VSDVDVERLRSIKSFPSLVKYLRDELEWPIDSDDFDELTFDYEPEELGLDAKTAVKIKEIKQLRPLASNQPWGIFFVNFEPKRLPVVVLRRILRSLVIKKRQSANKPQQAAWQLHDLLFISAYGESEHRDITLANFSDDSEVGDLPTLKVLGWDDEDTVLHLAHAHDVLKERLHWPDNPADLDNWRRTWSQAFTLKHREVIGTSKEMAERMAELATAIRKRVNTVLKVESEKGPMRKLMTAFREALIHDLSEDDFADMYAQTITYGLLSARVSRPMGLTAENVKDMVPPVTNPFLHDLLSQFLTVGGRKGKVDFDELGINDVVQALRDANMEAVIRDFDDKNPQEDPVIHFYELFLKEYDPKKRMLRGVFFTPRPVVSFIVRSVDEILQKEFGLADGLADTTTWGEMAKRHPELKIPDGARPEDPFVQILDPACGTGTFLVEVIDVIHQTMKTKWRKQGHMALEFHNLWNEYVSDHLLPRLYGFELMMAPYAIAHMKIGLKLDGTGYRFGSHERARIYLTNSLEPPQDFSDRLDFDAPALAHEAQAVNAIKRTRRFTVVTGNPPYSKSMSKHPWSLGLVDDFKTGLNEKKSDLTREEWKFLRFGYYNVEVASVGIVGLVINNAFLSAPTHRGIRHFLLDHSANLMIVDLHGDSRKGEGAPDGSADENVFEIQQGICVILGVKNLVAKAAGQLGKADIYGTQQHKYERLCLLSSASTPFDRFSPKPPMFFFRRSEAHEASPYDLWIPISEVFLNSNTGIQTKNDDLFTDISASALCRRMSDVLQNITTHRESICHKYGLVDSAGWRVSQLNEIQFDEAAVQKFLYKPFDHRFIYYNTKALGRARHSTMQHMLKTNLALVATRQVTRLPFCHAFVSRWPIEEKTGSHDRTTQLFPLYVYSETSKFEFGQRNNHRQSALSPAFISKLSEILGVQIEDFAIRHDSDLVTPEQGFYYIYSILSSPCYREQFGLQLMGDFPRIPLTGNPDLFRALARLGGELVALHLMESPKLEKHITKYVGKGDDEVAAGYPKYSAETVRINPTKGFEGVSEDVWNFHIGGYQVCEKWLKDRRGRVLSEEDIAHYQKIVVALKETIGLMTEIDEVIEAHGGWPGAFTTGEQP